MIKAKFTKSDGSAPRERNLTVWEAAQLIVFFHLGFKAIKEVKPTRPMRIVLQTKDMHTNTATFTGGNKEIGQLIGVIYVLQLPEMDRRELEDMEREAFLFNHLPEGLGPSITPPAVMGESGSTKMALMAGAGVTLDEAIPILNGFKGSELVDILDFYTKNRGVSLKKIVEERQSKSP